MKKVSLIILTLSVLLIACNGTNKVDEKTVVGLQPFKPLPGYTIEWATEAIDSVFGFEVVTLHEMKLPGHTYVNIKSPRYRADKLIAYLKTNKPDEVDYIMGLTRSDISTTKKGAKDSSDKYFDWGIFGLGFRPGPSCIVSTYRLRNSNAELFKSRFQKVSAHELGHNLGLPHCKSGEPCLMVDAVEKISTVDNAPLQLCTSCIQKSGIKKAR